MDILRQLKRLAARKPGKLVFLLLSLGISFGFIATIIAITHASWARLPTGVADGEYVTLGRRTATDVSQLALLDFENVEQLAPEASWFYRRQAPLNVEEPRGEVRLIQAPRVSGRFFELLGVRAAAGTLVAIGQGPAAVLSHDLWQDTYGGGAEVTEDFLQVQGGMSVPIVGVVEPQFEGILPDQPDAWILDAPFDLTGPPQRAEATAREIHREQPGSHIFGVVRGRAMPIAALRTLFVDYAFDTSGVVDRVDSGEGEQMSFRIFSYGVQTTDRLIVTPGIETNPDNQRAVQQRLVWLVAIVVLLLAMALVSLIDFLLAENLARAEEQTVRIAIGAGPADVFRQTMVENAVWIAIVALLGWFSSRYVADLLLGVEPFSTYIGDLPSGASLVGLAAGALLLLIAFAFGAAYASWFVSKTSRAMTAARAPDRLARPTRATLLFVGAASLLLVFSLVGRYAGDARFSLKFDNPGVLTVTMHNYEAPAVQRTLLDAIDALPGVRSSAAVGLLPLEGGQPLTYAKGTLRNEPSLADTPFYTCTASTGFIRTLGLPLLAGRPFEDDALNEVVISRAAAVAMAGDPEAALGRPVVFWQDHFANLELPGEAAAWEPPARTVVGVVEDVPYGEYTATVPRVIYNRWRATTRMGFYKLLIDHEGAADDVLAMIRASPAFEGWEIMGSGTPEGSFREQFMAKRSVEMVLSGAAAFALLLALAGVANSLARSLAEARSAIGIRLALGATTFDLSRRYAGSALGDLLLVAALVGALAFAAKLATPASAELLDLWLLIPATFCLAAVCAAVAHLLVRQFARRGSLNPLIQGGV